MSITEELQFSVLSAPLAAADRRLFSQAWYSALYRTDTPGATQTQLPAQAPVSRSLPRASAKEQRTHESTQSVPVRPAHEQKPASAFGGERRAPRLRLARKIARFVLQPRSKKSGATFTIDGARGRVRVLVRTDGSRLMGLGMFMLSPSVISLPVKLLLVVMVDGWGLVCGGVASSFR